MFLQPESAVTQVLNLMTSTTNLSHVTQMKPSLNYQRAGESEKHNENTGKNGRAVKEFSNNLIIYYKFTIYYYNLIYFI